ncbi:MAG: hypothetical protein HY326_02010 [Chloroflexi bacterium]|nr:hypothetical protein [Chloroflexota bacterium]
MAPTDQEIQNFRSAAARGVNWILSRQLADGSFTPPQDGIGAYYKIPYTLSLAGHAREAQQLLAWIAKYNFTAEGDFRAPERKALGTSFDRWPVYGDAWLILGAHRAGRWDLSFRGFKHLLRYQTSRDNQTGGFISLEGDQAFIEPVCTSWGGMAALATGHLENACRAGDTLVKMVSGQPDPQRFYSRMDLQGNLITQVPDGKDLFYYVNAGQPKQIYFNPGISLIYLTHLYRATQEERYLQACRQIFSFTERCAADAYSFPPSGKLGFGCALLYDITGDPAARRAAVQLGTYLVETQTPAGSWRLPDEALYAAIKIKEGLEVTLDITAEFSTFLTSIAALI